MSLLIDTSALVSARNADDKNHNKVLDIMIRALKGDFGKLYISDYIFNETVTIAYSAISRQEFQFYGLHKYRTYGKAWY
jgi:predicted nucleic acid-binding protein